MGLRYVLFVLAPLSIDSPVFLSIPSAFAGRKVVYALVPSSRPWAGGQELRQLLKDWTNLKYANDLFVDASLVLRLYLELTLQTPRLHYHRRWLDYPSRDFS